MEMPDGPHSIANITVEKSEQTTPPFHLGSRKPTISEANGTRHDLFEKPPVSTNMTGLYRFTVRENCSDTPIG
jgi:hypothetical protein